MSPDRDESCFVCGAPLERVMAGGTQVGWVCIRCTIPTDDGGTMPAPRLTRIEAARFIELAKGQGVLAHAGKACAHSECDAVAGTWCPRRNCRSKRLESRCEPVMLCVDKNVRPVYGPGPCVYYKCLRCKHKWIRRRG